MLVIVTKPVGASSEGPSKQGTLREPSVTISSVPMIITMMMVRVIIAMMRVRVMAIMVKRHQVQKREPRSSHFIG